MWCYLETSDEGGLDEERHIKPEWTLKSKVMSSVINVVVREECDTRRRSGKRR